MSPHLSSVLQKGEMTSVSYVEKFEYFLQAEDLASFLPLWEEYCLDQLTDPQEVIDIVTKIKNSSMAPLFGPYAESILVLWKQVKSQSSADELLRLILDVQTTNSVLLFDLAKDFLKRHFGHEPHFQHKLRLVGLVSGHTFQGSISHYILLSHMEQERFVFHQGGWGVGEVMEFSLAGEHVLIEFEEHSSLKEMSFKNAFKQLKPLKKEHFLALRFGNPEHLEQMSEQNPVELIRLMLKDLGPITSDEIKEALVGWIIPEKQWAKWWQHTRTKIKKDSFIGYPQNLKDPFVLQQAQQDPSENFMKEIQKERCVTRLIEKASSFLKQHPSFMLKETALEELKKVLKDSIQHATESFHQVALAYLLEDLGDDTYRGAVKEKLMSDELHHIINDIEPLSFKKRVLQEVRTLPHAQECLLKILFLVDSHTMKDTIVKWLSEESESLLLLKAKMHELVEKVTLFPSTFFWYFQKVCSDTEQYSLEDQKKALEAFLILFHYIENDKDQKELLKKMYNFLVKDKYAVFRTIISDSSQAYLQEILLLTSKCDSFTKHDRTIFNSLVQVVCPSLKKEVAMEMENCIWTTQQGFLKVQEKLKTLQTDILENAKEIEAARALGDLRENSEYKFALEKRARLQSDLKRISNEVKLARIITAADISTDKVGIGCVVTLKSADGSELEFTLLGPWEANVEQGILSFQSKLAQSMRDLKQTDSVEFQGKNYVITNIRNFLSTCNS